MTNIIVCPPFLLGSSSGICAITLYPSFVEGIALAGYGIGEIATGLMGVRMPSSMDMMKNVIDNAFPRGRGHEYPKGEDYGTYRC